MKKFLLFAALLCTGCSAYSPVLLDSDNEKKDGHPVVHQLTNNETDWYVGSHVLSKMDIRECNACHLENEVLPLQAFHYQNNGYYLIKFADLNPADMVEKHIDTEK